MALNFPNSPSLNDTYSFGGKTWVWNGTYWGLQSAGAINGIVIGNVTPAAGNFTVVGATGNITTDQYFIGNGSQLSGITASGMLTVSNTAPVGASQGDVWIQGNTGVQYVYFTSSGNSQWAEMEAATSLNFAGGDYDNSNVAAYLPTYIGSFPNLAGNVTTSANVQGAYIIGNITQATGYYVYDNSNVAAYLPTYTGNLNPGNINSGPTTINGNLTVSGNITASGNLTYLNVSDLVVNDPLIYLGANNTSDIEDLGIVANFTESNVAQHTGLARDYTDNTWKLFTGVISEPNTVIAWDQATWANLQVGNIAGNTNGYVIGYRDVPQLALSANTTLAGTDSSKHYYSTSSSNLSVTIPPNANVSFNTGTMVSLVQNGSGNILVIPGSGVTLLLGGNTTASGNRVVANCAVATLLKVATNTWFISGPGVS
jgi:hypothetical protein